MRLGDLDALKKAVENLVVGGAEGLKDYYENGSKSDENSWIGGVYDAWELIDKAPPVEIVTNEEETEDYQINQEENCNIVCDLLRDITGVDIRKGEKRLKLAKIWIPVSDRLPEEKINPMTSDFEEVLCTTIWGDVRAYKFGKPIGHDKPHFWLGGGIMDEYVIAWQYKPEPYKEGGAE